MLQPQWQSTATLVINLTGSQVLDTVKGVNEEDDASRISYKQYYETQKTIIRSRRVAESALLELGLQEDPVFLGTDKLRNESQRQEIEAKIDPVERLREMISVQEVHNSRILKISAEYPDPEIARDIANAVAHAYVQYVLSSRSSTGDTARENIEEVREETRLALEGADSRLQEFAREHKITSISLEDRQNLITQNIMTLSSKAKTAQARRIELGGIYDQAKKLHESGNLSGSTLLDQGERTILDSLRGDKLEAEREFAAIDARYGDKHPDWKKARKRVVDINSRIDGESSDLLASLRARYKAAQQSEKELERALAAERENALELAQLEPRYRALEREAKNAADAYSVVSRRDAELGMTAHIESRPVEILDSATLPNWPVRPNKILLMAGALIFGLMAGSGLALIADFRDHRIRGVADLDRALSGFGLQALGQLPLLPPDPGLGVGNVRAQRRRRDLYAYLFPQSLMAERCRGIRTSLTFALTADKPIVLLVTSPSSAEGKSSTAMNLALSYCQARKRVCLVDADMRRPRLHQVFPPPVDRADIGLSNVLSGQASLSEALQHEVEGAPELLSVLTCGAVPENPAELLDGSQCRKLMAELREQFDVIVVDTPPVLPVTDPLILAPQVDGVVMVARCQSTTRNAMQEALSALRQGDTNLLGVILNEVEIGRSGKGYYSSQYYTYRAKEPTAENA
jgi:capsular exopolysaccharide synthesis family protein